MDSQVAYVRTHRCGSSSSIRLAGCSGKRSSTSHKFRGLLRDGLIYLAPIQGNQGGFDRRSLRSMPETGGRSNRPLGDGLASRQMDCCRSEHLHHQSTAPFERRRSLPCLLPKFRRSPYGHSASGGNHATRWRDSQDQRSVSRAQIEIMSGGPRVESWKFAGTLALRCCIAMQE